MSLLSPTKTFRAREARDRVLYGKKAIVIAHARAILEFGRQWFDIPLTGRATQDEWKSFFRDKRTQWLMQGLMLYALDSPEYLRDIADALIQVKNGAVKKATPRPIALELIETHTRCTAFRPTLPEVKKMFIARKKFRWPGDSYARRLLRSLWSLPLRPAKRGRPKKDQKKLVQ